ncbi:MAG: transglycosylase SLT domain-containing protein [Alphaproteobacteria bacterium]|nr:transglycosylase SLT domain-containing protein [Alphaproteobacteria bacterium]
MTSTFGNRLRRVGAMLLLCSTAVGPAYAAAEMSPIYDDDEGGPRETRAHAQFLSSSDLSQLSQAFDAADRKDWTRARDIASHISNQAARDLVDWRAFVTKDNGATFAEINAFISSHRDWPSQSRLQARAEEAMPLDMAPDDVIAWFQGRQPTSGEGMLKLGEAYSRKGQTANAKSWIVKAWVQGNFTPERAAYVATRHSDLLTTADNEARLSRLLWADEFTQAQAMTNIVGPSWVTLMNARIKMRRNTRDADAAYQHVSGPLANDPGLLFDRARWLRKRDREAEARPLLIRASAVMTGPPPDVTDWWNERNYEARAALDAGDTQQAYLLAAGNDLTKDDGVAYAEAEFLAGWIALRYLNKPDQALTHFLRLREGVSAPISVARAHYWAGRAAQKAGRTSEASRQYGLAAAYPMTYYGQLAAVVANPKAKLDLPAGHGATPSTKRAFMGQSLMQAMQCLADVGSQGLLRSFAIAIAEGADDRDEFTLLNNFLRQLNEPALALRVAKKGLQKNLPVFDIAYPTTGLPPFRGDGAAPESALVLGLTRQESEFDPEAHSGAGARGLMQLMPGTAKLVARQHGLSYSSKNDLYSPTTNMQLGMAHVADLLDKFSGSYVLAVASYNAGAGRISQWISQYGDPRATPDDMVDWIERIPFNETRNYVQRVLENTQVYRNILAGRGVEIALDSDLKRGAYSTVSTVAPQFSSAPAAAAVAPIAAAAAAEAAGSQQTPPSPTTTGDAQAQFVSVVSSTPIADDPPDEPKKPAAKGKKHKKGKGKKSRRRHHHRAHH